jgi:hypothetical protein
MQGDYWIHDAAISIYEESGHHSFNIIGRNIADEYYILGGGAIPGRIPVDNTSANSLDQAATTPLGRTLSLQYIYRM